MTSNDTQTIHEAPNANASVDCGWGHLFFGQTFEQAEPLIHSLAEEGPDRRDIAFYVRDPHVLIGQAPQELFLDPSHTYRLDLASYQPSRPRQSGFTIRRLSSLMDAQAINRIYQSRRMVMVDPNFLKDRRNSETLIHYVAEDRQTRQIVGTVTGIDHSQAFNDPENGSSLWCLAVDPQARHPAIGEALVRRLAEYFQAQGRAYMDLSVMHDNAPAIALYERLGFYRVPMFAVKRRNQINEQLFTSNEDFAALNPYARIIVDEAHRRNILVELTDADGGFFRLTFGGRTVRCRESLTELTSAVAMSICDDKAVTRRVVQAAGVVVPEQIVATGDEDEIELFIRKHGAIVVKPARGEQGRGIAVGVETLEHARAAITNARKQCDNVLLEACFTGEDLRLVVIDFRLVAAALRRPPVVIGDGKHTIRRLIEQQSRRRAAATGGESRIPLDDETTRAVRKAGYELNTVLPEGVEVKVRGTANLHTGGTIHDVTAMVHPRLVEAAITAARAIDIPVSGIDFMVKDPTQPDYVFIEANERPGLANHEPQPTAERFVDLLFPLSVPASARQVRQRKLEGE
ncbi:N-acetylglutaminylglutamine synthetase [Aureimonas fodinaquatilis]|uniref:N-acetylglutaminylglutamine synthetase n=1 Tax=Aureimonas fodinaquatilis TaxID=2565783 RepID=A0A5B0E112_9HYPH|nr:N-acetylglutaminylglutamine synthetase [Aureimonas fodinaquatilis]KAA0972513.1 N-acetylglutaminylglutamine synthetase [Aureimonas fodinaquatilis]